MITFDPIREFNQTFQFRELTAGETIQISMIPKEQEERRLTKMLNFVLDEKYDARLLTVQQRYFLLLKYLEKQDGTLLEVDAHTKNHLSKYMYPSSSRSTWNTEITQGTITVRQLTGREAEYIERICKSVQEKLIALMAFQYRDTESKHQLFKTYIADNLTDAQYDVEMNKRFKQVLNLPSSEHQILYSRYALLNHSLNTHLNFYMSTLGFVLAKTDGGTDDAPTRFCTSDAFSRIFAELDGNIT